MSLLPMSFIILSPLDEDADEPAKWVAHIETPGDPPKNRAMKTSETRRQDSMRVGIWDLEFCGFFFAP